MVKAIVLVRLSSFVIAPTYQLSAFFSFLAMVMYSPCSASKIFVSSQSTVEKSKKLPQPPEQIAPLKKGKE